VQFEELTPEDCLSPLNLASVGRIGISVQALPVIAPVNFVTHGADVVFKVGSGNELAAASGGAVVAFSGRRFQLAELAEISIDAIS
jgi:nitroimidazol reductase NimA-like FMN-containing flavoprotein (pyridoxamine 5'-phosphate oxidase superfamily)